MRDGVISPTALWPQVGLNGPRGDEPLDLDGALRRWKGKDIRVELRGPKRERVEARIAIAERIRRPLVAAADADGRLRNALDWGDSEVYLVGRNITAGDTIRVYVVPRQHGWALGDAVLPVTLVSGRAATMDVENRQRGRFHIRLAGARELAPGAYDLIVRPLRYGYEDDGELVLWPSDIVVNRLSTGFVVRKDFMATKTVPAARQLPPDCRPLGRRYPLLQYADVFQVGEPVYAALDPSALNPSHTGKMVALYLVPHKTAAQWSADPRASTTSPLLAVIRQCRGSSPSRAVSTSTSGCSGRAQAPATTMSSPNSATAAGTQRRSHPTTASIRRSTSSTGTSSRASVSSPTRPTDTSFAFAGQFQYDSSTEGSVTVAGDFRQFLDVPLNAVVLLPGRRRRCSSPAPVSSGRANYPLVVIVHGNATPTTSYLG